jgi:hypothetical protein
LSSLLEEEEEKGKEVEGQLRLIGIDAEAEGGY